MPPRKEVSLPATRSGICPVCGKRGTRRTTITHTVNPFNRRADGEMKTRGDVWEDVKRAANEWSAGQFVHAGCEVSR